MQVVILSGSPRDSDWVDKIAAVLDRLAVPVVRRVGSPTGSPSMSWSYSAPTTRAVPTVFITVAGMSDALSGLTDANVRSPVVACPPRSDAFAGLDVLSSLRTPPGVAPIVALDPANAAVAAAKILGLSDPDLRSRIADYQQEAASRVLDADQAGIAVTL